MQARQMQARMHTSVHGAPRPCAAALAGRRGAAAAAAVAAAARRRRPSSLRCNASSAAAPANAADSGKFPAQVCVVLGSQWGDEGKGKLVDILAQQYDVVARAQGGANAGHTIYDDAGTKYALHLVPSGVLNMGATNVIGHGVVLHVPGLFDEMAALSAKGVKLDGRLLVSDRAHLLFDLHKEVDGAREAELAGAKIGTTKRGIGPAYASKATRNGLRVADLRDLDAFAGKLRALAADAKARFPDLDYDVEADIAAYKGYAERLLPFVTDTIEYVNAAHNAGKRVLVEGANATMLDLDFGTYPFVTSSNPSVGGVSNGLGLAPRKFDAIIGVAKAYTTRVGAGPYPTEIFGDLGDKIREIGHEYGTTTGRPRRVGWLDIVALRYAATINGFTHLNLTKLDVLTGLGDIKVGVAYAAGGRRWTETMPADVPTLEAAEVEYETLPGWDEDISGVRKWADLPAAARAYVERVEQLAGVEVRWIGVGPGRDAVVEKPPAAAAAGKAAAAAPAAAAATSR